MGLRSPAALVVLAAALLGVGRGEAWAQKPVSRTGEYSPYEQATIRAALEELGLEIDPAPEGKTIERFDTVRLPVLDSQDPWPTAFGKVPVVAPLVTEGLVTKRTLNALHHTTQDFVIRREMLLKEGDPYVKVILDETARNMRQRMPLQLSLILIVPVKGSTPDKVGVLVVTKDIWSLRASFEMAVTPGGIENFVLVPQETNLFGLHHTVQTRFQMQPESYTLGAGYRVPRFGRSWIGASASANIILNRRSGSPEGSSVSLATGQPLYSTRAKWAWTAEAGYSDGVARRYVNAHVQGFDARATPGVRDGIPFEYKSSTQTAQVGVTRSFGWALKNNFGLSLNASRAHYETFDLSNFDPLAVAEFERRALPRGETRVYPSLGWSTFKNDFLRTLNIATLALQEDYRLGHEVSVALYPVSRAFGSTRDFIGLSAKASYAVAMGDGLAGASIATVNENQDGIIKDGSITLSAGAVTPRFRLGRFVINATGINRYKNYLNARTFAGGDDRLRGYPSNFFFGKDAIFYNFEFRSRPVQIMNLQLGLAAFYDVGDATTAWHRLRPKQSVGVGLRTLIPQLNRIVFRLDFAFPMDRGPFPETGSNAPVDPFGFYFAFEQAFAP